MSSDKGKNARHKAAMEKQKERVDAAIEAADEERGVAILLTGNGKGKTSSAFGMTTVLQAVEKDGRPSAPSDASRGVSEISPRAGRRLHVPNAPPSVIEARRNRNALRRRKEHTRGDTDSRPARRQGPLVHGLLGPVTTNSGKGSPSTA